MHIGVFKKLMFVAAYVLPLLLAERPACAEVLDKSEVAASGGESSQKNIDIKNVDPDISSAEELKKNSPYAAKRHRRGDARQFEFDLYPY